MNTDNKVADTVGAEALRLAKLSDHKSKGNKFEKLLEHVIPQIPDLEVESCWRWKYLPETKRSEIFPGTTRQDIGIDHVAQKKDGSYVAIQAKCFDPEKTMQSKDLTTAIHATTWRKNVSQCWLITTCKWSKPLEQQLGEGWSILHAPSKWNDIPLDSDQTPPPAELDTLQRAAFNDVIKGFMDGHERGRLIMACGTGKTLVSQRVAEEITPEKGIVLYATPSIALTGQSRQAWLREAKKEIRTVVVCSQADAGESASGYLAEIESPATTNPEMIAENVDKSLKSLTKKEGGGGGMWLFLPLINQYQKSSKLSDHMIAFHLST